MFWKFRGPTALPRISAWIPQRLRLSSYPSHNNRTSPSEVKDDPQSFWHQLKKEDPDLFQMLQASNGNITKEFYASMRAKPEVHQLFLKQRRAAYKERYATVAEVRTADIERSRDWYQAHKHDEDIVRRNEIYRWFFNPKCYKRNPWTKDLPWTTYRPVAYTEKVSHYCTECGTYRSGIKSWWQAINDPNSFLCNKHYTDRGWSRCMPKGYEDIRTFMELRARYEGLNQK